MRRLIVNADDFGLTSGVNRAILETHTGGIVTSATLMANASAFEDAVRLASSAERLGVGCHIVLVDGAPIYNASQVPTLVNQGPGGEPRLRGSGAALALAAWAGRVTSRDIATEAAAQIGKLDSAGLKVTHVDTHKHVHMFPKILGGVLKAAQAWGVRAIRNPFETIRFRQFTRTLGSRKRWLQVGMLNTLSESFRAMVLKAGMVTPDGTLGVVATGMLDQDILHDLIEHCPDGTWELVCHPGYSDKDLDGIPTRLRQSRALELEVLTSKAARELLSSSGIELISYRQLL